MNFTVQQKLTDLEPGVYQVKVNLQGENYGEDDGLSLYAATKETQVEETITLNGWMNWATPIIEEIEVKDGDLTIGVHLDVSAESWGSIDDFEVVKVGNLEEPEEDNSGNESGDDPTKDEGTSQEEDSNGEDNGKPSTIPDSDDLKDTEEEEDTKGESELPRTGETKLAYLSVIGLGFILIGGYFLVKNKVSKNE